MLNRVYELEAALYRAECRQTELTESAKQSKFNLRQAKISLVEYGGIRAFVDKLSGRYTEKAELLSREIRKAEAELYAVERQLEAEIQNLSTLKEQRASLPPFEELHTPENQQLWAELESRFCAEALLPLLAKTQEALAEYRSVLRGEFPVLSIERQQAIGAAPANRAEKCRPLLQRLETATEILGSPLAVGNFFRSPAGFLAAAAKHNQLDRARDALDQTQQLQKELSRFPRLPEE